jgi:hypothetical protein
VIAGLIRPCQRHDQNHKHSMELGLWGRGTASVSPSSGCCHRRNWDGTVALFCCGAGRNPPSVAVRIANLISVGISKQ